MIYKQITFIKKDGSHLLLKDRTLEDALFVAKELGFEKPKWYKPSTWGTTFHTIREL